MPARNDEAREEVESLARLLLPLLDEPFEPERARRRSEPPSSRAPL